MSVQFFFLFSLGGAMFQSFFFYNFYCCFKFVTGVFSFFIVVWGFFVLSLFSVLSNT